MTADPKPTQIIPPRKAMLKARRVDQLSRRRGITQIIKGKPQFTATPYLHPGKYNGEDLRKIRKQHAKTFDWSPGQREFRMWNYARINRPSLNHL